MRAPQSPLFLSLCFCFVFSSFTAAQGQHSPLFNSQDSWSAGRWLFPAFRPHSCEGKGDNLSPLAEGRKVLLNLATAALRSLRTTQTTVSEERQRDGAAVRSPSAVLTWLFTTGLSLHSAPPVSTENQFLHVTKPVTQFWRRLETWRVSIIKGRCPETRKCVFQYDAAWNDEDGSECIRLPTMHCVLCRGSRGEEQLWSSTFFIEFPRFWILGPNETVQDVYQTLYSSL